MCNWAVRIDPWLLFDVPDCFRNLRMSIRAMQPLRFITPGHPKTQGACERAVERPMAAERYPWSLQDGENVWKCLGKNPWCLKYVPDHFKTEKMCKKALEDDKDHFQSLGMCEQVAEERTYLLQYVPDWFVTREGLYMWYDDSEYHDDDNFFKWYDGYKKQKVQKASIKEQLLTFAWNPSRYWNWCISEADKKEGQKKCAMTQCATTCAYYLYLIIFGCRNVQRNNAYHAESISLYPWPL